MLRILIDTVPEISTPAMLLMGFAAVFTIKLLKGIRR
jgi:hypothetical protein